ncbi:MAG TPA: AAA family ATPase [Chloroflexota bacterium]|nr:AAA family ATPase [Chloroflexota bacterium]
MFIREIRLENIKSYGSPAEVVRFERGVNAISGQNGAGKSTILEAIGCALFQYLPYKHQQFVREAENSGTITVVVESRLDGRTYEVVRRIGSGQSHTVFDPDIRQNVARGAEEVRVWLQKEWRLQDPVALSELFINAVGPPQGSLTAIFLDTASVRRSKFDPLLRVEEYEEAYRRLNAIDKTLEEEQRQVEDQVNRLSFETEARIRLEDERAQVRDLQADLAIQLSRLSAERASLEREIVAFGQAEQNWRDAIAVAELASQRESSATLFFERIERDQRRAAEAAAICERTTASHEHYREAEEALRGLEIAQSERERVRQQHHAVNGRLLQAQNALAHLDTEILRLGEAEREVVELRRRVPEQEASERKVQAARDAKRDADQLARSLAGLQEQIDQLEGRVQKGQRIVRETEQKHLIADELPARRARHQALTEALAAAIRADGECQHLRATVQETQQQIGRLTRSIDQLAGRIATLQTELPSESDLAALETQHRSLADERAAADSQLQHAHVTRLQVSGGLCPFLHEACKNLRPGVTLETHFDAEIVHWTGAVGRLTGDVELVDRQLRTARTAATRSAELAALEQQQRQLRADLQERGELLKQYQAKLQEAAGLASQRTERERQTGEAERLFRDSERAFHEVANLSVWTKALEELTHDRDSRKTELANAQERLSQLQKAAIELPRLEAELHALGDPRARSAQLATEVARQPELKRQHDQAEAARRDAAESLARLDGELQRFHDLDERLVHWRRLRENTRADHDAFLASAPLARTLNEQSTALQQAQTAVDQASATAIRARQAVDAAGAAYDVEAHRATQRRQAELNTSIGSSHARIEAAVQRERELIGALARIHEIELTLAELRRQAERIIDERALAEHLRRSVRAAGPDVTRQLLRRISRTASRINSEVLDRSGIDLEWVSDYEIITRRQGENRGFGQLSGGEQMAAALAVRLAILRDLSNVRIAFLDEPTAHLDQDRRTNLGDQVQRLQGFDQLIVISHDDTFDGLFGHVIRIVNENGRSRVAEQN